LPDNIRKFVFSGFGICLIIGIILSILAPYGTGRLGILPRLTYWTVLCLAGAIGAAVFMPLAAKFGRKPSRIMEVFGQSITSSILVTALLAAWNNYNSSNVDLFEALYLFVFVWVIGITITTVVHLAERASRPESSFETSRPDLYERLKPNLRNAEIYALMAEDHYVRVFTSNGEDLILMRLSDAVKEMGNIKGLPVHRSWWVAEAGVKAAKKSDGKISLELHSGQIAPVSRSNAKSVKLAGWVS